MIDRLFDWYLDVQRARKWRKLICPHGHYYSSPDDCPKCPKHLYGYGEKTSKR